MNVGMTKEEGMTNECGNDKRAFVIKYIYCTLRCLPHCLWCWHSFL